MMILMFLFNEESRILIIISNILQKFISKKKNQADQVRTWFGRSGEGKSNPKQCGTKTWLSPFIKLLFDSQYEFGDRTVKARENLS